MYKLLNIKKKKKKKKKKKVYIIAIKLLHIIIENDFNILFIKFKYTLFKKIIATKRIIYKYIYILFYSCENKI